VGICRDISQYLQVAKADMEAFMKAKKFTQYLDEGNEPIYYLDLANVKKLYEEWKETK